MARFLVMGCGGIGGIIGAHLQEARHDVSLHSSNPAISRAVAAKGFQLTGEFTPNRMIPGQIHTELPSGPFDFIILATQPPQVEEAAQTALPALAQDGVMVVLQNGLCEDRIARIVGPERVIGAVLSWGASMPEPGVYEQTSAGGFCIGRLDGSEDPRLSTLSQAMEVIGPCELTNNLAGKRWSKLAISCTITSLGAIGGDRLGVLMQQRMVRRLALELMTEVVEVARAEKVKLEKVSGTLDLEWMALSPEERRLTGSPGLLARHSMLLAVGFRYRRLKSSMLGALERGRPPAVEFLNGEVVERGQQHGISTPVNASVRELVWAIARKEAAPGIPLIRELFEKTAFLRGPEQR